MTPLHVVFLSMWVGMVIFLMAWAARRLRKPREDREPAPEGLTPLMGEISSTLKDIRDWLRESEVKRTSTPRVVEEFIASIGTRLGFEERDE